MSKDDLKKKNTFIEKFKNYSHIIIAVCVISIISITSALSSNISSRTDSKLVYTRGSFIDDCMKQLAFEAEISDEQFSDYRIYYENYCNCYYLEVSAVYGPEITKAQLEDFSKNQKQFESAYNKCLENINI